MSLAIVLLANGPVASALGALLPRACQCQCPADPTCPDERDSESELGGCCCGSCSCDDQSEGPGDGQAPPSDPADDSPPPDENQIDSNRGAPSPACPGCPHGRHCPTGCCWCAANAPCCLSDGHVTLDVGPCLGPNLVDLCLLAPTGHPDKLFHPPRA